MSTVFILHFAPSLRFTLSLQSAVCILHSVCILPLVHSLQSAVGSAFYTDRLSIQQSIDVRFNVRLPPPLSTKKAGRVPYC